MARGDPNPFPTSKGYPFTWSGKPRRMASIEIQLWQWFIRQFPKRFDNVWFDAMIPSDPSLTQPSPDCPANMKTKWPWVWGCLTCLRADVLGQHRNEHQIIEIRSNPRLQTLYQSIHITLLFTHRYPDLQFRPPIVICNSIPTHIKMIKELKIITLIQRAEYPM